MIGKTWTPRQRLRAVQGGAALGAVLLHVVFLVFVRPDPRLPWLNDDEATRPPVVITLYPRPRPQDDKPSPARKPEREERNRPLAPPSPADVERLAPPSPSPSAPPGPPRNPGQPGVRPGINWGGNPPDGPARKTLRGLAGCALDIPLTRAERDRCDERFGRDRNRARSGPLMADKARQREFERQGDYKLRLREYREAPPPAGLFNDLRDMGGGQAPPEK